MNRKSGSTETAQLLRVVTAVVVVSALYVGRTVFIPLAPLQKLLSLLLAPVMDFLGRPPCGLFPSTSSCICKKSKWPTIDAKLLVKLQ